MPGLRLLLFYRRQQTNTNMQTAPGQHISIRQLLCQLEQFDQDESIEAAIQKPEVSIAPVINLRSRFTVSIPPLQYFPCPVSANESSCSKMDRAF